MNAVTNIVNVKLCDLMDCGGDSGGSDTPTPGHGDQQARPAADQSDSKCKTTPKRHQLSKNKMICCCCLFANCKTMKNSWLKSQSWHFRVGQQRVQGVCVRHDTVKLPCKLRISKYQPTVFLSSSLLNNTYLASNRKQRWNYDTKWPLSATELSTTYTKSLIEAT